MAQNDISWGIPLEINKLISRICQNEHISSRELKAGSRYTAVSRARAQIAIELVRSVD
jgi:chromosomal replication initiation ATPase DnaA